MLEFKPGSFDYSFFAHMTADATEGKLIIDSHGDIDTITAQMLGYRVNIYIECSHEEKSDGTYAPKVTLEGSSDRVLRV